MIRFWFIITLLISFTSCVKDQKQVHNSKSISEFFPITQNRKNWIYDIYEIKYSSFAKKIDTTSYQVRETFDTFFLDNLNRNAARFSKFRRPNDSAAWNFQYNYYVVVNDNYVERVENNTRMLKLSFPAVLDALWDENERNNNGQNLLFYTLFFGPYSGKHLNARTCVKVENEEIKNNFEHQKIETVYAKDIGVLYSKQIDKQKVQGFFDGFERTAHLVTRY